jgi:hypothetical protein
MTVKNQNFEMYQGENKVLVFDITDSSGSSKDLTGCSATFVVYGGTSATNKIEKSSTDGEITFYGNDVKVFLVPSDTSGISGKFYWELRLVDGANNSEIVAVGTYVVIKSQTG